MLTNKQQKNCNATVFLTLIFSRIFKYMTWTFETYYSDTSPFVSSDQRIMSQLIITNSFQQHRHPVICGQRGKLSGAKRCEDDTLTVWIISAGINGLFLCKILKLHNVF